MKKVTLFVLFIVFIGGGFSVQSAPLISFEQLMIKNELNPSEMTYARAEAVRMGYPVSIKTADNQMAEVLALENGQPVYLVITNFAHPYEGGFTAFYYELPSRINTNKARIDYGNGRITDNTNGHYDLVFGDAAGVSSFLMVTDATNDRVYIMSAQNGDLIDTAFVPQSRPQLSTPKHAIQHFNGRDILIADQITDVVQRYSANGAYTNVFAPIGGPITSILDNIRGVGYLSNNNLLVTVGSGTSQNTVQQFDTAGVHLGTFMSANLNSPFDPLVRSSDILVSNSSGTNRITRYDLSGAFLSNFYTGAAFAFPQQMHELPNGNIVTAAFSPPSGIAYLASDGTFLRLLTGITGNRGIWLLGNGNYLTTNGGGIHEIDSTSGALVRTIVSGTISMQYIDVYNTSVNQLRVNLNYQAFNALDTFTVEVRNSTSPYALVESRIAVGGNAVPAVVNFTSVSDNTPYYIVLKHRNSIETWSSTARSFQRNYLRHDFTTSNTQAFGNNMILSGTKWSLYTGDVNQDGTVDITDLGLIDNDAFNFGTGYLVTDLNYDNIVDVTDISLADNNASAFIGVIRP